MGHVEHRAQAPASTRCWVLTISDSRTIDTDTSGRTIADLLGAQGHQVVGRDLVTDDPVRVRTRLSERLDDPEVQVIITTGGTGISARDGTFEVVHELLDKELQGFGELFRYLSFQEIGPAAMLSRACGGLARGKVILSLPGSEPAVRLAMTRLILPELGHLVREASR